MFLNPIKHVKYNFTLDFFEKSQISPFYESLINLINKKEILNPDFKSDDPIGNIVHEVKFIPSFFSLGSNNLDINYKVIKYKRIDNYLINLEGCSNSAEYLKCVMTPKHRKQIRAKNRRLEACFKITYTSYFGEISEPDYKFLFHELKKLIEKRFKQRGDKFFLDDKWSKLIENTYQQIMDKTASFFVVYDEEKPISISLNYHFQNITQSFISSYDIDYSKFGIGHIAILKKIDWCISNNFKIFDLMWGEVPHKILWCNAIRQYEHHFIYKNNHILKAAYVKLLINLYGIKDYLNQRKITKSLPKLIKSFKNNIQSKPKIKRSVFKLEAIKKMPLSETITKININREPYAFLRKPVYDFQYLNFEQSANVMVFKDNIDDDSYYLIKGIKSHIKVLINRN